MIKMRNPWASELYHGPWCDDCDEWNTTGADTVTRTAADDGVFFMDLDTYMTTFDVTHFTRDTSEAGWSEDHFLMLDDNTQRENPGSFFYCGSECTKHKLKIRSDVD